MRKLILLLSVLAITSNAQAMRCKGSLILVGDSVVKVISKCGQPIHSEWVIRNDRVVKMLIYKKKYGREKRVFLRNGTVIGVVE